jgi:integrase
VFLKAVMDSNVRRQFKVALRLILLTLVRKSELMLARWEHVDVEKAEWHIPAENSTTGGVRGVYNRAEYAGQRREMLSFWGEYVEGLGQGV